LWFDCFSKTNVEWISSKPELKMELVGSWNVAVGDMDQCLHLWKYTGGFQTIDTARNTFKVDEVSSGTSRSGRGSLREATFRIFTVNIPIFITCWLLNGICMCAKIGIMVHAPTLFHLSY